MSTGPMNDYRNAMEETRLSPEQRKRLENAVSQARAREEAGAIARPAPRVVTRRAFAIGAAAAFAGLAGFGALNAVVGAAQSPVNSFGLKAYALDDPARPSGYTEVLTKNVLTRNVGGYFGAWEDEEGNVVEGTLGYAFRFDLPARPSGYTEVLTKNVLTRNVGGYFGAWEDEEGNVVEGTLGYAFRFDLECIGENVASYSYHIEGDQAYFGLTGAEGSVSEEFFPDGSFYVKKYECSDSLFVTKENQEELGVDKHHVPLIVLALPMDEEFQAAYDLACSLEHTDASEYDILESGSTFDRFVEINASRKISESAIHVTAAYDDGTSETKTYRIAPVEDFEERYLAFQEQRDEALMKEWSGEVSDTYPDDPELYTITEVS